MTKSQITGAALRKETMAKTRFGELLRRDRVLCDETLRDRSAKMGISFTTLQRLEIGRQVNVRTFLRVLEWLMEGTDGDETDD